MFLAHSIFIANPELNAIASVDVSLSDAVQNVSEGVLNFILVPWQLLHDVVVAHELVIEHSHAHGVS